MNRAINKPKTHTNSDGTPSFKCTFVILADLGVESAFRIVADNMRNIILYVADQTLKFSSAGWDKIRDNT
jgi:hypothetical protein